jgi:hypothetical protein
MGHVCDKFLDAPSYRTATDIAWVKREFFFAEFPVLPQNLKDQGVAIPVELYALKNPNFQIDVLSVEPSTKDSWKFVSKFSFFPEIEGGVIEFVKEGFILSPPGIKTIYFNQDPVYTNDRRIQILFSPVSTNVYRMTYRVVGSKFKLFYNLYMAVTVVNELPYPLFLTANLSQDPGDCLKVVPSPPSGALPTIDAVLTSTEDGKMLCQLDYKIIYKNLIKNYILYNLDFLPFLKGCGGTIEERVEWLNKHYSVDRTLLISYSITRTILSSEIFCLPFSFEFLKQEWYERFLEELKVSEWSDFVPFFEQEEYGVSNYWKLYK